METRTQSCPDGQSPAGKLLGQEEIAEVLDRLEACYPDAACALHYENPFQLLVAVALSAQTTDKSVNAVTPALFAKYPDARALAAADPAEVEPIIHRIGMYRTKAKNIVRMAEALVETHDGQVPADYEALTALPGVGRKTANVVLAEAFGEPRIAVDTHVFRVANRIGLTCEKDVYRTELSLMDRIPRERWTAAHHTLIFHGRQCCTARNPACARCVIAEFCVYRQAQTAPAQAQTAPAQARQAQATPAAPEQAQSTP